MTLSEKTCFAVVLLIVPRFVYRLAFFMKILIEVIFVYKCICFLHQKGRKHTIIFIPKLFI